jgi:hypothetical protein
VEAAMNDELRILFGIDDSDFSRTALKATESIQLKQKRS